jgi:integrase
MKFEDTFFGRPNTINTYTSLYFTHIKPLENSIGVLKNVWNMDNTLAVVEGWEYKKLSKRTIISLVRLLGRYIEFIGGPKIETTNVIRVISKKTQEKEIKVLSRSDYDKLMKTCKLLAPDYYPVMLLALHAGLRRGEVYGLEVGDIDLIKGKITISKSYKGPTKNSKTRIIPISPELSFALTSCKGLLSGDNSKKVFKVSNPNPKLRGLCRDAGVEELNFHALRHGFATLALESGVSPRKVASWLGHSSVTTTLSIYWQVMDNSSVEDMNFLT